MGISLSSVESQAASALGYIGKAISKHLEEIQSQVAQWQEEDAATLAKMRKILDTMTALQDSASRLSSIDTDDLKHGSANKWAQGFKNQFYDIHLEDIEKMIKKAHNTVSSNQNNAYSKISSLSGKIHISHFEGEQIVSQARAIANGSNAVNQSVNNGGFTGYSTGYSGSNY